MRRLTAPWPDRRKGPAEKSFSFLFIERGFDRVTIDEIADAADVGRMTVFNHFPRKEDMFFDREDEARDLLVGARAESARAIRDEVADAIKEAFAETAGRPWDDLDAHLAGNLLIAIWTTAGSTGYSQHR